MNFNKFENCWVNHYIAVGVAADRIARTLGIYGDFVEARGYLYDVGRKISYFAHVMEGYHYLEDRRYRKMVR